MKNLDFFDTLILRTPLNTSENFNYKVIDDKHLDAILIASPVFFNLLNTKLKGSKKLNQSEKDTLISYIKRQTFDSTPFGQFSGCTVIRWGDFTNLSNISNLEFRSTARLDMTFLSRVTHDLFSLNSVRNVVTYCVNQTLVKYPSGYKYVEPVDFKNGKREFRETIVNSTSELRQIIKYTKKRRTIDEILNLVKSEYSREEVLSYLNDLIDNRLLISELELNITGEFYFNRVIKILDRIKNDSNIIKLKDALIGLNDDIIKLTQNFTRELYLEIIDKAKCLIENIDSKEVIQIDSFPLLHKFSINKSLKKSLTKVAALYTFISPFQENTNIESFKEAFFRKFESSEVPLKLALDPELGVGYGYSEATNNDFIKDLTFKGKDLSSIYWDSFIEYLIKKINLANLNNVCQIDIGDFLDKKILNTVNFNRLSNTFAIMFSHLGFHNGRDLIRLHSIGGSTGLNLIGRFAYASESIYEVSKEIADYEENSYNDAIVAEIVHAPSQRRLGNVLHRPVLRKYEIPILTYSGVDDNKVLDIDDLWISIWGDKIRLRSRSLNKEIIPKLSTAHNFGLSELPIYKFLCDIQNFGHSTNLGFRFDQIRHTFPYVPRIIIDNVIIAPARWKMSLDLIYPEFNIKPKSIEPDKLKEFALTVKIPRYITVELKNKSTFFDLLNDFDLLKICDLLKKNKSIVAEEFLPDIVEKKNNASSVKFSVNEIVAFVKNNKKQPTAATIPSTMSKKEIKREFLPGSEWVYFNIYCGAKISDYILINVLKEYLETLEANKLISKWFFLRFNNPEYHIRLRILTEEDNQLKIINDIYNLFNHNKNNFIWKLQIDTYRRELERYGADNMQLCESIFYYDSKSALKLIREAQQADDEYLLKYSYLLISINKMLDCFKMDDDSKKTYFQSVRDKFAHEFNLAENKSVKIQIDKTFRNYRDHIQDILFNQKNANLIVDAFSDDLMKLLNNLYESADESIESIAESLIHMMINRVISNQPRLNEFIIYHLLYRTYESKIARKNEI